MKLLNELLNENCMATINLKHTLYVSAYHPPTHNTATPHPHCLYISCCTTVQKLHINICADLADPFGMAAICMQFCFSCCLLGAQVAVSTFHVTAWVVMVDSGGGVVVHWGARDVKRKKYTFVPELQDTCSGSYSLLSRVCSWWLPSCLPLFCIGSYTKWKFGIDVIARLS